VANWQALVPLLERMPAIAAVSPMVTGGGLALRGEATQAISLVGVELDRYDRIVGLRGKVVRGSARLAPGEAILGATWRPIWACAWATALRCKRAP
jgi:lipoprotein-releasing system permease protein